MTLLLDRGADIDARHLDGPGDAAGYAPVDFEPVDVALFEHDRGDLATARLLVERGAACDLTVAAACGDLAPRGGGAGRRARSHPRGAAARPASAVGGRRVRPRRDRPRCCSIAAPIPLGGGRRRSARHRAPRGRAARRPGAGRSPARSRRRPQRPRRRRRLGDLCRADAGGPRPPAGARRRARLLRPGVAARGRRGRPPRHRGSGRRRRRLRRRVHRRGDAGEARSGRSPDRGRRPRSGGRRRLPLLSARGSGILRLLLASGAMDPDGRTPKARRRCTTLCGRDGRGRCAGPPAGLRRAAARRRRVDRRPRSRDRRDAARLGDASRPSRHRRLPAPAGRRRNSAGRSPISELPSASGIGGAACDRA